MPEKEPTSGEVAEQIRAARVKPAAESEALELDEEPILEPSEPKTRVGLPKKVSRKKKPLTGYEYMTTLKGFDPYTFEGM